jgi:HD-like signal output (HDOD) protein
MLISGAAASRKSSGVEAQNPLQLLKSAVGDLSELPMLPDSASRAMAVANDPGSSLRTFARVIEQDPTLATGILRLANSALYGSLRKLASLDQAVVRLGLRECQNLIIAVGMRTLFRTLAPRHKQQLERLWHHSFVTASLCRHLGRLMNLAHRGGEFSAGLLHDLGRVLVAMGAPNHFELADPLDFNEEAGLLAHEQSVLGTDHCAFGSWFAKVNYLPDTVVAAIAHHHAPTGEHIALVELVAAADHMANALARGIATTEYDAASNPHWWTLTAGWTEDRREGMAAQLAPLLGQAWLEASEVVSGDDSHNN